MTFGAVARHGGGWLPLITFTALAGSLAALALPLPVGRAVDAVLTGVDAGPWLMMAGALVGLGLVGELAGAYAGPACAARTAIRLRTLLARHILAIGPDRARRFDSDDLVGRMTMGCADAAGFGPAVATVVPALLAPVGSAILLWYLDPVLAGTFVGAGIVAGAIAGMVAVGRARVRPRKSAVAAYDQTRARLAARLAEALSGARTIAAAGTLNHEVRRVLDPLALLRRQSVRVWRALSGPAAGSAIARPLVVLAVVAVGGYQLGNGRITAGDLLAAVMYAALGAGLGSLPSVLRRVGAARTGARKVQEIRHVLPVEYGTRDLPLGPGRLELRSVTVRSGDAVLLDAVDLTIPGASTVAVVGRPGSGASVLADVLTRLRDPDEGEVLLDGVPLRELDRTSLRSAVGRGFRHPVLVGATVADAIGPDTDRRTVAKAATATHAHDFIVRLPEGYDTSLDQAPMSAGDRQRLGLARAWLAERVLVLDDADAELDLATQLQIGDTLTGSGGRAWVRTRVILTDRVTTAARADLVVWMSHGRVRDLGMHERLWEERPDYREVFA